MLNIEDSGRSRKLVWNSNKTARKMSHECLITGTDQTFPDTDNPVDAGFRIGDKRPELVICIIHMKGRFILAKRSFNYSH